MGADMGAENFFKFSHLIALPCQYYLRKEGIHKEKKAKNAYGHSITSAHKLYIQAKIDN